MKTKLEARESDFVTSSGGEGCAAVVEDSGEWRTELLL